MRSLILFVLGLLCSLNGLSQTGEVQTPEPMFVCSKLHPPSKGPCAVAPKVKRQIAPQYSEEARQAKLQGLVRLWLTITPEGKASRIRVARSLGKGLDEEAIRAVKQWEFEPATFEGKPVAVQVNVEVNFSLYK